MERGVAGAHRGGAGDLVAGVLDELGEERLGAIADREVEQAAAPCEPRAKCMMPVSLVRSWSGIQSVIVRSVSSGQ
jgi:hypothetical protein